MKLALAITLLCLAALAILALLGLQVLAAIAHQGMLADVSPAENQQMARQLRATAIYPLAIAVPCFTAGLLLLFIKPNRKPGGQG